MSRWSQHNLRIDVQTAAAIEHGIALQGVAGPAAAYQFFLRRRIPMEIVRRVMACPRERRQAGVIGIVPADRYK